MIVHAIVDYSFLYYKYKFQLDSGKMRRLTTAINWKGTVIEKDISQIYYSIKEIEGFRRKLEMAGHNVFVSVCFDMPSARKEQAESGEVSEAASKYKSNRVKRLNEEDFENIQFVEKLLSLAGYNTYRINGYEADDIISHLVANYKDAFDYTVIYTPDADVLVNICGNVGASRYKAMKGYASIDINNFTEYLSAELKCNMPYNGLMLYKATVGDKSDCIDGIKKFGPAAFNKLVDHLNTVGIEWENMGNWRYVEQVVNNLGASGYFTPEQYKQAFESLSIVRPMQFEAGVIADPIKHSTRELREAAYMPYKMQSLVD